MNSKGESPNRLSPSFFVHKENFISFAAGFTWGYWLQRHKHRKNTGILLPVPYYAWANRGKRSYGCMD